MWGWYFFSFGIFTKNNWDEPVHHKQLISSVWKLIADPVFQNKKKFKYENYFSSSDLPGSGEEEFNFNWFLFYKEKIFVCSIFYKMLLQGILQEYWSGSRMDFVMSWTITKLAITMVEIVVAQGQKISFVWIASAFVRIQFYNSYILYVLTHSVS